MLLPLGMYNVFLVFLFIEYGRFSNIMFSHSSLLLFYECCHVNVYKLTGFRVYLGFAYFAETENFLLKVL